jgi:aerobic-type carbon monoxide dehydrogenase small subunit (CoxS/CutS family)
VTPFHANWAEQHCGEKCGDSHLPTLDALLVEARFRTSLQRVQIIENILSACSWIHSAAHGIARERINRMSNLNLTINGNLFSVPSRAGETLAELLRNRLGLTGTKVGCEEAECGACTVLVEGEPILSCVYPAERANGKTIVTIEGLARRVHAEMKLHPLQEAFVEHGAVQCGFCIPGQIMTAYALLGRNPNPGRQEIRASLKDTLCRCAGYPTIENAIVAAALHADRRASHAAAYPDSISARMVGRT